MENAQTLASHNWKEIPPCYLQPEADDSFRIPVIDMSKLLDQQDPISYRDELARLRSACQDWGFFQLINHGVPEEVVEKMKNDTEEFFMLPLEKKQAYAQLPNNIEGYWLAFVPEEQKLDLVDTLFLIPRPVSERNMRFWPMHPASFRESIDKYSWEMQKVTICLLNFMSTNLGVNSEALTSAFEYGRQSIRLNFYPPCVEADNVKGFPHSDASGLSLLVQVNDVRGLQIKKNGKWLPVKPIPGAFIVNIGDMIEMMSNGEYEHRAQSCYELGKATPFYSCFSVSKYENHG